MEIGWMPLMATNKAKARTLGMAWRQKDKVPTMENAYVGPPGCEWRPCSGFRRRLGGTDGLMGHCHGGFCAIHGAVGFSGMAALLRGQRRFSVVNIFDVSIMLFTRRRKNLSTAIVWD